MFLAISIYPFSGDWDYLYPLGQSKCGFYLRMVTKSSHQNIVLNKEQHEGYCKKRQQLDTNLLFHQP
jgi:hypothetical protein